MLGMVCFKFTILLQQLQLSHGDLTTSSEERHLFSSVASLGKNFLPMSKLLENENWTSGICSLYNEMYILPSRRKVGIWVGGNGLYILEEWYLPQFSCFFFFSAYSSQTSDPLILLNKPGKGQ